MGPAMENVMKTQSRWRSANRKTMAAAEIIMENIQPHPPPHRLRLSRPQVSAFRRRTDVFHLLLQDGGAWQCREAVG